MAEPLNGKDYRARVRLSNGPDTITFAHIGETCERVPTESLSRLLASRKIEPVVKLYQPGDPNAGQSVVWIPSDMEGEGD